MNKHHIKLNARLEAHAILDRLVADGPTFSLEDACRLIDLIPIAPRSRFSFTGALRKRGPGAKGHAAGIGDVNLEGETEQTTFTLNAPASYRIGGYVVTHTPGHLDIELMWAETQADRTGQACSLIYDVSTSKPEEMRIAVQKSLTVLFVTFNYISFVPWKTPRNI
ncbi:hypothetical protein [Microvirga guangxiensis]|uniref:Uncharacterized protein n=1 Tax=Microvirga guangxiensis TaxID=549386 RepID=A0A1G5LIJ5_9HYPH|nr:hypothetical protein [Microvirga guangxiensis]SCZ12727.1 hypothetical protein SAMN02927923_04373 [Microvirga guangxiensis]